MSHTTYILYSETIDKYYIGYSSMSVEERLYRHMTSNSGFTSRARDWRIVYVEHFEDKISAIKREQEIKKWKSRKRLVELIQKKS